MGGVQLPAAESGFMAQGKSPNPISIEKGQENIERGTYLSVKTIATKAPTIKPLVQNDWDRTQREHAPYERAESIRGQFKSSGVGPPTKPWIGRKLIFNQQSFWQTKREIRT
jgi:hypothetical protein